MPNPMAMGRAFLAKAHLNNKQQQLQQQHGSSSNNNHLNSSAAAAAAVVLQQQQQQQQSPLMHANGNGSKAQTENTLAEVFGTKDAGLIPNKHRAFLMDTQVKYTVVSSFVPSHDLLSFCQREKKEELILRFPN